MRFRGFLLLALAACVSFTLAESKHGFEIFLTVETADGRVTGYGTGDWSRVKLADSPIISDADIISYDWSQHSMHLRPEALVRIPRPPVGGKPFVVVADGQRIYLGAFNTCISSIALPMTSIMIDRRMMVTNQPDDVLFIDRAYPGPSAAVGPDPRSDARVKEALAALHKLKE